MKLLIKLLLNSVAVYAAAELTPGVNIDSFWTAIIFALVLGVLNTVVKPILKILTFPLTIITLGLFSLIINLLMIALAAALVPGFSISGILPAIIFGVVLSIINGVLGLFDK